MLVSVDLSRERSQLTFESIPLCVSSSELCARTYLCLNVWYLLLFLYILKKENI
jgi:hypothetical protein